MSNRDVWVNSLEKTVKTPFRELLKGRLKSTLPIRGIDNPSRYQDCTYLELLGRMFCGIAPAIERSAFPSNDGDIHLLYENLDQLCESTRLL